MKRVSIALVTFAMMFAATAAQAQPKAALTAEEVDQLIKENEKLKAENKRLRQASQRSGQASSATAVVDLKRTYDSLRQKVSVEADFKTREEAFKAENGKREDKLKQIQESMKDLKPGSGEYVAVQEQLERATGDYRVWVTVEAGKINRDRAAWLKAIYAKMLEAIAEASAERGYDLVLFKSPTVDFTEVSSEQVPGLIQSRKVLWSVQELDLTDLVIQKMNLAFDKSGGR